MPWFSPIPHRFYSADCLAVSKRKVTQSMLLAAAIGFIGVLCVAKPDSGLFNLMSVIGLSASFLAAMAFVTVRALTQTEPPERIVFYFCLIGTLISMVPMFWHWRPYTLTELGYLIAAGLLANTSQLFLSNAYKLAPAGQIGPVNYIAIFFAGLWGFLFWQEVPDLYSLLGLGLIFCGFYCVVLLYKISLGCVKAKKSTRRCFLFA